MCPFFRYEIHSACSPYPYISFPNSLPSTLPKAASLLHFGKIYEKASVIWSDLDLQGGELEHERIEELCA